MLWLLTPPRPDDCRRRVIRWVAIGCAWCAWETSAGHRWPRWSSPMSWRGPGWPVRCRWTAPARATGISAARWTRERRRSWPGAGMTAPRTGPGCSIRPGSRGGIWCSPWTAGTWRSCAGWRRTPDPVLAGRALAGADPYDGEVPDPYGGAAEDYALALDLVQAAARGLAAALAAFLEVPAPGRSEEGR